MISIYGEIVNFLKIESKIESRTNTAASRKSSMSEESIPNEGSFQLLNVFVDKNIQKKLSTEERSIRLKKRSIIRKLVERLYKNDPFLNSSKEKKRYFVSDFAYFKNKGGIFPT